MIALKSNWRHILTFVIISSANEYNFQGKHAKQGSNLQISLPLKLSENVQLHFFLQQLNYLLQKTLKLCTFPFFLFKTTRVGSRWATIPQNFLKKQENLMERCTLMLRPLRLICKCTLKFSFTSKL